MSKNIFFMTKNRLIILLLILPFFVNGPTLARENSDMGQEKIESRQIDGRAQVLQAYLALYNSPLAYQAQNFIEAADQYNLDWKLVAAIAGVESTFGKFIPGGYNAWGWGVYGNQALYFRSWKEGIFTVSEGLRRSYFDRGLTDPYLINRAYAASPAWGGKVSYFLKDIEKFQQENENKIDLTLKPFVAGSSGVLAQK